tara:strand:+ start:180 stop:317 length:138 start_codon:yes stop_codon:yes gene_type:complete
MDYQNLNSRIWAWDMMSDEPETCVEGFDCEFEDGVCIQCGEEEDE